jgi:hypothetical protein
MDITFSNYSTYPTKKLEISDFLSQHISQMNSFHSLTQKSLKTSIAIKFDPFEK